MKRQIRETLFAVAAASALGACASSGPVTRSTSLNIPDFARVVRNGQELFCKGPEWVYPCVTRDQAEAQARARGNLIGSTAPPYIMTGQYSIYTSYTGSGR